MANITSTSIQNTNAWFKHWFDSSFYQKLYMHRDEKEAALFIDNLVDELQPLPNSRILDLGCGSGRHSKYLATMGYRVTGIDLAASSIREAKAYETPKLNFYRHDMRAPFGKKCFDYVFNFFTSFGYFENSDDDHLVIRNIADSLKDNGIVLIDYLNGRHAERNLVSAERKEVDGAVYHIIRQATNRHFVKRIIVKSETGEFQQEFTERVSKFTVQDFDEMLSRYGVEIQNVFGDYQLGQYDAEMSPRLIIMAQKKG